MISIDQLLESVDLDFEPRWVTKDKDGCISLFSHKPDFCSGCYHQWRESDSENPKHKQSMLGTLKLTEFEDKPWSECIYEVPRKVEITKIEEFTREDFETIPDGQGNYKKVLGTSILDKLNTLVDAVNELKGAKNE